MRFHEAKTATDRSWVNIEGCVFYAPPGIVGWHIMQNKITKVGTVVWGAQ